MRFRTSRGVPEWSGDEDLYMGSPYSVAVVVLSLTVEWGVGMERQDPSYGVVVHTSVFTSSGPSLRK